MLNIYRASAGSGKTFQLTRDYLRLLFHAQNTDRPHRRILAVTFTNKATDEMKSRILQELHLLAKGEKSDHREVLMEEFSTNETAVNLQSKKILTRILHDYSYFSISTIDKFFQQVIRSFAREIGIGGGYNLELDVETTLQQAVDNLYMDLSEKGNEQLLNWMTMYMEEQIENSKSWNIQRAIATLGKEIFKENYQHKAEETSDKMHNREFLAGYRKKLREIISRFKGKINEATDNALIFLKSQGLEPAYFKRKMMYSTLTKIKNEDFELGSIFLAYMEKAENCYTKNADPAIKNAIDNAYHSGLKEKLEKIAQLLDENLREYNSAKIILKNLDTLGILSDLAMQIRKLTSEQNVMLISDTNLLLNKIIDNSDTPFVYERTGINIDHYMIDEFQDTSVLQWKNFKPLISNSTSNNNFNMLVGDVKQSIYRWRNSDWNLLEEQAASEFSPQQIDKKTLDTNWRSDKNIVHFNNLFFKNASLALQEKLNDNIESLRTGVPALEPLKTKISHAYGDIKQQPSKNAGIGRVQIEFIKKEKLKADREMQVLARIPALLENLVDRGYKPSDIAFLVRNNAHAVTLTEFLLSYKNSPEARNGFSYAVVGNEGLPLSSSPSVNFIIATLSVVFNPKDDVNRTVMLYEYQTGKLGLTEEEAIKNCFSGKGENQTAQLPLFTREENECVNEINHLSLFEATEKLIDTFKLEEWHREIVFLQAFQDVVFNFVNKRNADLSSFLRWWQENSGKQFINVPENQQAFKVMTIHKSKGLDFKVVIIPFCNWELDAGRKAPLLWCKTEEAPFEELPLMPIEYGKSLINSIFSNEYFDEQMHQYIDNLNLAYVAFTRARNEMIIFAEKSAKFPSENITSISDLLARSIAGNDELVAFLNEENSLFELGEPTTASYKEADKNETISRKLSSYPIIDSGNRLKIRHASDDYRETEDTISESRVNYGKVMHEILQKTIRRGDEKKAVSGLINAGKIAEKELPEIQKELDRFWSLLEVNEWFSNDDEVLNECDLLLPSGEIYRPDRVLIQNNKATVIEYKFGKIEKESHIRQLQRYVNFLKEMGYSEVDAKLYYVSLGKVIYYIKEID